MLKKYCLFCKKEFKTRGSPSIIKAGRGKFCSKECFFKNRTWQPRVNICRLCGRGKPNNDGHIRQFCSRQCKYDSQKGKEPWNKGKENIYSEQAKRMMSLAKIGHVPWNKGMIGVYKQTIETRIKMSSIKQGISIVDWKDFKKDETFRARMSPENKIWRDSVFRRDNYTCIWCGMKGGWNKKLKKRIVLNADHIKPFSLYPELRFVIDNGRTLCRECHQKTSTYGINIKYAQIS